ncbi:type IV pilin protein [Candidatus Avelusimicrobium sp.]|uniref:type IV pilin protein n=1 Tax=Candidatus Avelusimicrobium sp. TaxID=3048833 RepID=UPI003D7E4932
MNNKKGFTLIELLVVVLILGILAAMAMPQYFKAVERSRMTEAVTLMANIADAQQRKYLQVNRYAAEYTGLDVAPKGASGSVFYTKGTSAAPQNGFAITLVNGAYNVGKVTAERVAPTGQTLQYNYSLERFYTGKGTTCTGTDTNGAALCADYCGIDTLAANASCCSTGSTGACADATTL